MAKLLVFFSKIKERIWNLKKSSYLVLLARFVLIVVVQLTQVMVQRVPVGRGSAVLFAGRSAVGVQPLRNHQGQRVGRAHRGGTFPGGRLLLVGRITQLVDVDHVGGLGVHHQVPRVRERVLAGHAQQFRRRRS